MFSPDFSSAVRTFFYADVEWLMALSNPSSSLVFSPDCFASHVARHDFCAVILTMSAWWSLSRWFCLVSHVMAAVWARQLVCWCDVERIDAEHALSHQIQTYPHFGSHHSEVTFLALLLQICIFLSSYKDLPPCQLFHHVSCASKRLSHSPDLATILAHTAMRTSILNFWRDVSS